MTLFPCVWFAAVVKLTLKQISSPSNLLNIHDIYTEEKWTFTKKILLTLWIVECTYPICVQTWWIPPLVPCTLITVWYVVLLFSGKLYVCMGWSITGLLELTFGLKETVDWLIDLCFTSLWGISHGGIGVTIP